MSNLGGRRIDVVVKPNAMRSAGCTERWKDYI